MVEDLDRVAHAYRAPVADEADDASRESTADSAPAAFYVVSVAKLVVLDVLTMRLYSVYWFYKHWELLRRRHGLPIRPLARGIFSIFYAHRLFRYIDRGADSAGFLPDWNAGAQATLFVVLSVLSSVAARLGAGGALICELMSICTVLPLASAQKVANLASGDPEGEANSRFHAGSVVAATVGGVLWASYIWLQIRAVQRH